MKQHGGSRPFIRQGPVRLALALLAVAGVASPAPGQSRERLTVEVEGGPVWQTRNDVRVPNPGGTEFSLVDAIGQGPAAAFRVDLGFDPWEKHGFRVVLAPLEIEGQGRLDEPVSFAGAVFAPGVPTDASYQFSSYRLTYRYRFFKGSTWTWKGGLTAFVRDARIALEQGGRSAEDTDVGVVPLLYLGGEARWPSGWQLRLDVEGSAASQGRAFDVSAKLGYALNERWDVSLGYRTIEGGADVEQVYNFAWLHFAVVSVRFRY
jgi:hypothetical protein